VQLDPYRSFGGYAFSLQREDLIKRCGEPLSARRNEVALNEMDYGNVVLRFRDSGRLEEITARVAVLHLGAVAVPFENLQAFVQAQDEAAFWRARFLVSPAFGFAFDPTEPPWLTALAKHCLPEWEAL
jgi:hypothetical protein